MPDGHNQPRIGLTVRVSPETHRRLRDQAKAERRSVSAMLELAVERMLEEREERPVIQLFVAPEIAHIPFGDPGRRPGESDESYAMRKETIDLLFGR